MLDSIAVYLPIDQSVADHIDRGSGIVGTPDAFSVRGDRVTIDFEGNRYDATNIVTFADRVMIAAGRHQERYPTIARMSVEAGSVVRVGTYDGSRRIALVDDQIEHVAAWIGCTVLGLPNEMRVTR